MGFFSPEAYHDHLVSIEDYRLIEPATKATGIAGWFGRYTKRKKPNDSEKPFPPVSPARAEAIARPA
jgi:hypothetical protein